MAQELFSLPRFEVIATYAIAPQTSEIYTKLNNHHGDAFGKCRITCAGHFQVARIRILDSQEQPEQRGIATFAMWGTQGALKIRNAHEGKTTLRGIAMLLVEVEELPLYLQNQIKEAKNKSRPD